MGKNRAGFVLRRSARRGDGRVPWMISELAREAVIAFNSPLPNIRLGLFRAGGPSRLKISLSEFGTVRGKYCMRKSKCGVEKTYWLYLSSCDADKESGL
jgi:hypothetical protein